MPSPARAETALQRLIVRELSRHADAYLDMPQLSRLTHCSAPDVARAVDDLRASGLLRSIRRNGAVRVALARPASYT